MEQISQDTFRKWEENNEDARNLAWEWMFKKFYQRAVVTCFCCCGCDPQTGEQMAADALHKTFEEIDDKVINCQVDWQGEEKFSSFVWRRLFFRSLDEIRKWAKEFGERILFAENEEGTPLIDILPGTLPPPEDLAIQKEALAFLYETLLNFKENKLAGQPALQRTVQAILDCFYLKLRECLDKPPPDRASFEELLEAADSSAFNSTRKDLYEYLEKTLGITRNILYQRMKKIRDLLKKFFREENIF